MERIDLISKQSKMSSYVVKHWKLRKTQNYKSNQIRINLHRFDVKTIKTTQNYESDQIIMQCIDLMSKRSKQRKTTILIKLLWIASIWCQNGQKSQNYERDQIIMHCIDLTSKRSKSWVTSQNYKSNQIPINLHRFDVKTIKNVELRRKTFKTTQNYKTDQITMNCIDLMSKRSKQR